MGDKINKNTLKLAMTQGGKAATKRHRKSEQKRINREMVMKETVNLAPYKVVGGKRRPLR